MANRDPQRLNFEGDLDYHLGFSSDLEEALYDSLLDYVAEVDATTVDALAFVVSDLGWDTFRLAVGRVWNQVTESVIDEASEQVAQLPRGLTEGIAA